MNFHYQDIDLYYESIGEGKAILLLHGLGCDHHLMKECMEPVFKQVEGYRRIYVDLPGMGRSSANASTLSADHIVATLSSFIQHLCKKESFLIMGESYGGYLARGVLTSMRKKVDGICLLCPVIEPIHAKRHVPDTKLQWYDADFLSSLSQKERSDFCASMVIANKDTYARYQKDILPGVAHCDRNAIHQLEAHYRCTSDIDASLKAQPYNKPALFLCGRQDTCVGYQDALDLLDCFPRASFLLLDMAGHHLQVEQPALMEEAVRNWLTRTAQKGEER